MAEVYHNTGPDIRSLSTDGSTLVFDRLGEIYTLEPGGQPKLVPIDVTGDMPDVRPHIQNVAQEVENIAISPTGLRAVVEAHGEILTVPAKRDRGALRNITNSPGVMEREPAWSPDGQSIAYFSEESGLYALHVAAQTGARTTGAAPVRKYPLAAEAAYYFQPLWSPDSRKIAFYDNRLHTYVLDLVTGRLSTVGEGDVFGGFGDSTHAMAWSPDSRWLAYPRSVKNHLHVIMLYSTATGASTQLTDSMGDARFPAFDRNGKYLYFTASNNAGATQHGLDMSSDLYSPTSSIYALALTAETASPVGPQDEDEKSAPQAREKARENADATPAGRQGDEKAAAKGRPQSATPPAPPTPAVTAIDVAGQPVDALALRIAALPLPPRAYSELRTGKPGSLYFLERAEAQSRTTGPDTGAVLSRWTLDERKTEKLAERVLSYEVTADGEKMLLAQASAAPGAAGGGGRPPKPSYAIVAATAPQKPGEGALALDGLEVRVDPAQEWAQMYREVWRIERAYFYDPGFHGLDTVADEKRFQPYVAAIQSRSDLNYVFQEMLTGFSVGHLRGTGGAIPSARRVAGGLLGRGLRGEGRALLPVEDLHRRQLVARGEGAAGPAGAEREGRRLPSGDQRRRDFGGRGHPETPGGHGRPGGDAQDRARGRGAARRHRDPRRQRGAPQKPGLDRLQPTQGRSAVRRQAGLCVSARHRRGRLHQLQPVLLRAD